jgi:hypothetical protein
LVLTIIISFMFIFFIIGFASSKTH